MFRSLDVRGTLQLGQRHKGIGLIKVLALLRPPDLQAQQIAIPAKAGGAELARLTSMSLIDVAMRLVGKPQISLFTSG